MQVGLGPAKGKDTATTLGPWLVTADEFTPDEDGFLDLALTAEVNGVVVGSDLLSNMGWPFGELVAYASRGTEVRPGDVLGSGTCGHGGCLGELWGRGTSREELPPLASGDVVTLTVEGIGTLSTRVVAGVAPEPIGAARPRPRRRPADRVRRWAPYPWGCTLGERLDVGYLSNTVGNPVETTVALSRLVHGGVLDAAPGVRVLAAHGGGFFPYGTARQDHAWHARPGDRVASAPPSRALRRLWFDALVYTPEALRHLVAVAGADRVVLGTDYPFDMGVTDPLERLAAAGLDPAEADLVRSGSAAGLLT
jgi:hypothetical protein